MITRYTYKTVTWIDVSMPSIEEVRDVVAEVGIPSEFTADLAVNVPHSESRAERGILKLTLDYPVVRRTDMKQPHEVKFIATKQYLVTFHYEEMEALHRFGKEFEIRCVLQNGKATTPPRLLVTLLTYLYDNTYLKLDYLDARLHEIEDGIFSDREREMVFEISDLTRRLISFRQVLSAHEDALEHLREHFTLAFGNTFVHHVNYFNDRLEHLNRRAHALSSAVEDLRNTNMALLSTKENEIMKMLTTLAFITYPLTLFTSTFGMNTESSPIIGQPYDFWIIIGIMACVSVGFFSYFRWRGWI